MRASKLLYKRHRFSKKKEKKISHTTNMASYTLILKAPTCFIIFSKKHLPKCTSIYVYSSVDSVSFPPRRICQHLPFLSRNWHKFCTVHHYHGDSFPRNHVPPCPFQNKRYEKLFFFCFMRKVCLKSV